jgi:hypothetical protein
MVVRLVAKMVEFEVQKTVELLEIEGAEQKVDI